MTNENLYSPPKSDVTDEHHSSHAINHFPRKSAWLVFLLSIVTFGMYGPFWLYTRTVTANQIPNHHLSIVAAACYLGSAVIGVFTTLLGKMFADNIAIAIASGIMTLAQFVFYIIAAFSLRATLEVFMRHSGAQEPKPNKILTFLFSAIYMQYKINKCLDELKQPKISQFES